MPAWTRVVRLLTFALVFMMTPGLAELVDDVEHLIVAGHTEHSAAHAEGHHTSTEHGCSGTFHVCSCHQSPVFVVSSSIVARAGSGACEIVRPSPMTDPPEGVRRGLARPPRA